MLVEVYFLTEGPTLTLISYSSLLSWLGFVVRLMHPLVLFMSKTPSLPENVTTENDKNKKVSKSANG